LGLRERKKERARAELEKVALRLFESNGYGETTVEEIARHAELSPASFFRYFGSKEDVVFAYEQRFAQAICDIVDDALPPGPVTRAGLETVILRFTAFLEEEHEVFRARSRLVSENAQLRPRALVSQRIWEVRLADALAAKAGLEVPDLATSVAAAAALATMACAVRVWMAAGCEQRLGEIVDSTIAQLRAVT
jgi:AcrR family transcriptional regulator